MNLGAEMRGSNALQKFLSIASDQHNETKEVSGIFFLFRTIPERFHTKGPTNSISISRLIFC